MFLHSCSALVRIQGPERAGGGCIPHAAACNCHRGGHHQDPPPQLESRAPARGHGRQPREDRAGNVIYMYVTCMCTYYTCIHDVICICVYAVIYACRMIYAYVHALYIYRRSSDEKTSAAKRACGKPGSWLPSTIRLRRWLEVSYLSCV